MQEQKVTNNKFFKTLFVLAIPIIIQNFLFSTLNFIDTLMIGQLGEEAIAGVGLANQFSFIFIILQFGIHSGISIYTAQYWGKKDVKNIQRLLGMTLIVGTFFGIIFTLLGMLLPGSIITIFSKDPIVIDLGSQYLRVIACSYIFTVISFSFIYNLRSTEIVSVPLYTSIISVGTNIFLNYVLIFGKLGFPELGVVGAAVATAFSRGLECLILIVLTYARKYPAAAKIKAMFDFDMSYMLGVLKTSWPVFLHEFVWVVGVSVYHLVYARISTSAVAAVQISATIENFAFILFFGMSSAGGIVVGNKIGASKEGEAFQYAKKLLKLQLVAALVAGGVILMLRGHILSFYNVSEFTRMNAYNILRVMSFVFWAKVLNLSLIVGIFRGGGDTRFGLLLDLSGVWLVGIPMAFIGAFVLHLPVYWVVALVVIEEVYKISFGYPRFRSKKWITNVITSEEAVT